GQLLALAAGQAAVLPGPRVPLGLLDPFPDRGLGQVEVAGHLADGPVPALAQLDDLGLELRRERTTVPPGLLPHALHDRTSSRGRTPDDGCPSKRVRPKDLRRASPTARLRLEAAHAGSAGPGAPPRAVHP